VNWGAGRGFDATEFKTFGVAPEEGAARFREAVDIVIRAWSCERLTYRGRFFSFDDVEVLPKPLQKPYPPAWVAAGSADAIRWAASQGHSILMSPHSSHTEIGEQLAFYREQLAAHGRQIDGRDIPIARLIAIAHSDSEAVEVAREGAKWLLKTYVNPTTVGFEVGPERYVNSVIIHGTPERVADQIVRLREEIGLNYLIGAPLSHQTFLSLTDKVLPRIG
jgi:alkanesulfonate monooxygenase SsuD/methylene tetrahydromethanopterin reductase-like flavin-dependent oxidoreductase (luciferase family)